jgi:hypothetical protein
LVSPVALPCSLPASIGAKPGKSMEIIVSLPVAPIPVL